MLIYNQQDSNDACCAHLYLLRCEFLICVPIIFLPFRNGSPPTSFESILTLYIYAEPRTLCYKLCYTYKINQIGNSKRHTIDQDLLHDATSDPMINKIAHVSSSRQNVEFAFEQNLYRTINTE